MTTSPFGRSIRMDTEVRPFSMPPGRPAMAMAPMSLRTWWTTFVGRSGQSPSPFRYTSMTGIGPHRAAYVAPLHGNFIERGLWVHGPEHGLRLGHEHGAVLRRVRVAVRLQDLGRNEVQAAGLVAVHADIETFHVKH